MKASLIKLGLFGVVSLAATGAQAVITVSNPSFEGDQLAPGTDDYSGNSNPPVQNIAGWTVDRNDTAVMYPNSSQFAGTLDGTNVIWLNGGIVHQDLGTMVSGRTYSFDISYGWRSDLPSNLYSQQFAFILRPSISSANSLVISQTSAFTEAEPPGAVVTSAPLPTGPGVLQHDILSYTATSADDGQPLTLQLQASDLQLLVDQVKLTTTVPEPASIGLAGLAAAAGLGGRRRRQ